MSLGDGEPLRVFITGGADTGKTFEPNLIVERILRFHQRACHKAVSVTASTELPLD